MSLSCFRSICKYWNINIIKHKHKAYRHISLQYYSTRYLSFPKSHSMSTTKRSVSTPNQSLPQQSISKLYDHAQFSTQNTNPINPISPNPTLLDIDDAYQYKLTPKIDYTIPNNYDWTKTSANNYSRKYQPIDFIDYEYSKSLLDYTYHGYYTAERQEKVHNPIISYYKTIAINKVRIWSI